MKKNKCEKLSPYHSGIIKGIFKGMTIAQIAQKMCCSVSTVSYHINSLYTKYNVKTRCEFIISIFGEMVDKYKLMIDKKDLQISCLLKAISKLDSIVEDLDENKNSPDKYEKFINEAKNILNKFTY